MLDNITVRLLDYTVLCPTEYVVCLNTYNILLMEKLSMLSNRLWQNLGASHKLGASPSACTVRTKFDPGTNAWIIQS